MHVFVPNHLATSKALYAPLILQLEVSHRLSFIYYTGGAVQDKPTISLAECSSS